MRNALLSVYDKTGIVEFARGLVELGFTIYASGGTYAKLRENGVEAKNVSELVGGEAILGHRVVTLSREVHAGLLAKDVPEDRAELGRLGIPFIDLVCVDMYPLIQEIERADSTLESVIEMTDIGGPTMLRSGAKGRRIVVSDPNDRDQVIAWLRAGSPEDGSREMLCAKAELMVANYVTVSGRYLSNEARALVTPR